MKLAVRVAGGGEDEPVQPVAVNYALAGILRSVVFHASQRRCYLPEDLLKGAGQRLDWLYEGKPEDGLPGVVREVAVQAVEGVRCGNAFLCKSGRLADIYLKQLKGCGYDVFSPKMLAPPAFKALRILF
jgi:phytoene/squalene synthetase